MDKKRNILKLSKHDEEGEEAFELEYLLSLNEIELNKTVFNMGLVEISSLLEDCLREIIPELEEKQIKRQKLLLKDQMEIILRSHREAQVSA